MKTIPQHDIRYSKIGDIVQVGSKVFKLVYDEPHTEICERCFFDINNHTDCLHPSHPNIGCGIGNYIFIEHKVSE